MDNKTNNYNRVILYNFDNISNFNSLMQLLFSIKSFVYFVNNNRYSSKIYYDLNNFFKAMNDNLNNRINYNIQKDLTISLFKSIGLKFGEFYILTYIMEKIGLKNFNFMKIIDLNNKPDKKYPTFEDYIISSLDINTIKDINVLILFTTGLDFKYWKNEINLKINDNDEKYILHALIISEYNVLKDNYKILVKITNTDYWMNFYSNKIINTNSIDNINIYAYIYIKNRKINDILNMNRYNYFKFDLSKRITLSNKKYDTYLDLEKSLDIEQKFIFYYDINDNKYKIYNKKDNFIYINKQDLMKHKIKYLENNFYNKYAFNLNSEWFFKLDIVFINLKYSLKDKVDKFYYIIFRDYKINLKELLIEWGYELKNCYVQDSGYNNKNLIQFNYFNFYNLNTKFLKIYINDEFKLKNKVKFKIFNKENIFNTYVLELERSIKIIELIQLISNKEKIKTENIILRRFGGNELFMHDSNYIISNIEKTYYFYISYNNLSGFNLYNTLSSIRYDNISINLDIFDYIIKEGEDNSLVKNSNITFVAPKQYLYQHTLYLILKNPIHNKAYTIYFPKNIILRDLIKIIKKIIDNLNINNLYDKNLVNIYAYDFSSTYLINLKKIYDDIRMDSYKFLDTFFVFN